VSFSISRRGRFAIALVLLGAGGALVVRVVGCPARTDVTIPPSASPSRASSTPEASATPAASASPAVTDDEALVDGLWQRIYVEQDQRVLTPAELAIAHVIDVQADVSNGGFDGYFTNSAGDHARQAEAALLEMGLVERAGIRPEHELDKALVTFARAHGLGHLRR
jgi:hypothetical protein